MATKDKRQSKLSRLFRALLVSCMFTLLPAFIWVLGLNIMMTFGFASIDNGPSQHIDVVYQIGAIGFVLVSLFVYKAIGAKSNPTT